MDQMPCPMVAAAAAGPMPTVSCGCPANGHRAACRIQTAQWARQYGRALRAPATGKG